MKDDAVLGVRPGVESSSSKRDTRKVVCNKKGGMAGEIGEGNTAGGIGERSHDG